VSPRAADPRRARGGLETPVHFLKGVGPRRAELLKRLNIFTARDLLFHIPHRYEDASTVHPIARLRVGDDATVIGTVISKGVLPTRKGLRVFQAVVQDASGLIEAGWPGQPFLDRTINKGDVLLLTGPVRFFHGRQLAPREFVNLGAEAAGTAAGACSRCIPATEGLSAKVIRGLIETHLDTLLPQVEEYLPAELLAEAGCRRCRTRCARCTGRRRWRGAGGACAARVRGTALRAPPAAPRAPDRAARRATGSRS
jgi:ATP-dependent DNA helicase RecG